MKKEELLELARLLRYYSLTSTTEAGSGHPTTCLSAADLMAVFMGKYYHYDFKKPDKNSNDRLIFSKGHAAPLLYAMYTAAGAIDEKELMTLRKHESRLAGHPVPDLLPWVDVATGSLGQGLSVGVGMALAGKYLDEEQHRVFVLMGDSEVAEGSVWEAAASAAHYKLDNMVGILDVNRLGQSQETMYGHDVKVYEKRFKAFGWQTVVIDGHNLEEIDAVFEAAMQNTGKPFVIIAKTLKGKGVSSVENLDNKHGKPLSKDELKEALAELGEVDKKIKVDTKHTIDRAKITHDRKLPKAVEGEKKEYPVGETFATRAVYGPTLARLGHKDKDIVAIDGETKNSTYAEKFMLEHPDRFFEMYIAEQNMLGVALGLSKRGKTVFASSFAAFLTRGYDQIRMAAASSGNFSIVGSHAGVSIGEDGASQMGLEDLAMMRAVHGSAVVYPSDAISTDKLIPEMIHYDGLAYMRTSRPATEVLYDDGEKFPLGGSKVLRKSNEDQVCIMACGVTLHEALKAYEALSKQGILVRVVDVYSIKPIDINGLHAAVRASQNKVVTVEDHWWDGGLGDAVLNVFAGDATVTVEKMAVVNLPTVGTGAEMMREAEIDAEAIVQRIQEIVSH